MVSERLCFFMLRFMKRILRTGNSGIVARNFLMEISVAIKAGLVGRIEEVLKSITIILQSGSS
ncbi:hypothetical protein BGX24_007019 [Mortierella sp. AD032]|nr:hypothetical protein BGX24_007019 [Mortierella sp. AD032]